MIRPCLFVINGLLVLILTACWDSESIEDRGFVIGTAIDLGENKENHENFLVTNQFVIPSNVPSVTNQGGGGEPFMNISADGISLFQIDQEMSKLTNKLPFFEHLKIIIVSEEIASTPHLFSNLIDVYVRSPEMRRGIKVVISEEAKLLLNARPKAEKLPAIYIESLLEKSARRTGLYKPKVIGDIHEEILKNSSYVLPKIIPVDDRIEYEGGVVFHGTLDHMVGSLTDKEMIGLNLILGKNKSGTLEFEFDENIITAEIEHIQNTVSMQEVTKENLQASIDINVEASIQEVLGAEDLQTKELLKKIEYTLAEQITLLVKNTINKAQNELHADIFQLDSLLKTRHPQIWKTMKEDWVQGANYFSKTNIKVTTKADVHSIGNAVQVKEKSEVK